MTVVSEKYDIANESYNYVQQRHKEVMKLEQSIQEVNQLFVDMAGLVDQQGEVVDRISHNVTNAKEYCHEAKVTLTETYTYKKKYVISNKLHISLNFNKFTQWSFENIFMITITT